ncbi:MAG: hypothetical protein WD069_12120 [Planctomycetales bacterium]
MTLWELVILLLIAGVCGSVARALVGFTRGGCLASVALGFIGAFLGTWIARQMALPEMFTVQVGDQPFPIIWSIIGAALFAAVLALLSGRRTT